MDIIESITVMQCWNFQKSIVQQHFQADIVKNYTGYCLGIV